MGTETHRNKESVGTETHRFKQKSGGRKVKYFQKYVKIIKESDTNFVLILLFNWKKRNASNIGTLWSGKILDKTQFENC